MRFALLTAIVVLALASPAAGQDDGIPRLGDHQFVPVLTIAEPFMTTFVQTQVDLAFTFDSQLPLYSPVDSTELGLVDVDQAFTSLAFGYQHRVQDWLVVQTEVGFLGRLGTDTSSIVTSGITGALMYELGWMIRMARTESTMLSGSLALGSNAATFVDPLGWANSIIEGEPARLVVSRSSLAGTGGLHGAWALGRRFGLLGAMKASYGEAFDSQGKNGWHTDARAALSYDAEQDLRIPVGLALTGGWAENETTGDADAQRWFWSLRIAAKGRSDFTIGLQLGMSYFESKDRDDPLKLFETGIDMRYYY
jgi:hypothetical protein